MEKWIIVKIVTDESGELCKRKCPLSGEYIDYCALKDGATKSIDGELIRCDKCKASELPLDEKAINGILTLLLRPQIDKDCRNLADAKILQLEKLKQIITAEAGEGEKDE